MEALREAVRELVTSPSAAGADGLASALSRVPPSAELAAVICDTLEVLALHEVKDSTGRTVRWRLVDRLLGLGFPYALHVSPDDLEYHRARTSPSGRVAVGVLLLVTSLVSTLWTAGLSLGLIALGPNRELPLWLIAMTGSAIGLGHGIAALVASVRTLTSRPPQLLRKLGAMFFVGPAVAGLAALLTKPDVGTLTLVAGAPSMLTATACLIAALVAGSSSEGASLPQPLAEAEAEPAQRASTSAGVNVR